MPGGLLVVSGALVLAIAGCSNVTGPIGSGQTASEEGVTPSEGAVQTQTPTESRSPAAPVDPPLAFVRDGEIVLLNVATGEEEVLVAPEFSRPLAWTADGQFLMVLHIQPPPNNYGAMLARYPLDGSNPAELLQVFADYGAPAWSPDGRSLAIGSDGSAPNGMVIVNLERGEATQLTRDGAKGPPVWSPDGRLVAYETFANGANNLFVAEVATGTTRQLTDDESYDLPFAWTDDGQSVLIISDRGTDLKKGSERAWQVDVETGALTPRPDLSADLPPHALRSPNGRWDALSGRDGSLAVAPAGEAPGVAVTRVEGGALQITWAPDGDQLISTEMVDGALDLILVEAPDGEPVNITQSPADESYPVWGPAHHGP